MKETKISFNKQKYGYLKENDVSVNLFPEYHLRLRARQYYNTGGAKHLTLTSILLQSQVYRKVGGRTQQQRCL